MVASQPIETSSSRRPTKKGRRAIGGLLLLGCCLLGMAYGLLMIPSGEPAPPGARPLEEREVFEWDEDKLWQRLEVDFEQQRKRGCEAQTQRIRFAALERAIDQVQTAQQDPAHLLWTELEQSVFDAAVTAAACPPSLARFSRLTMLARRSVRESARDWPSSNLAREQLHRLLHGIRAAHEHAMLQAAFVDEAEELSAVHLPDRVPASSTPSSTIRGVELHSGDLLLSRGNAPTSALIARGNAFPGSFSHVALVYVSSEGAPPVAIEAHIEQGSVVSTVDEYLADEKLRVLVLRPRADEPGLVADPMLPHRAARRMAERVRREHVPYDFAMDFHDGSELFCSEVASLAYAQEGLELWAQPSRLEGPGLQGWLWSLGVRHFVTQAPSDLEYDPQLAVVAEWRDVVGLARANVDDAVVDALLAGANRRAMQPAGSEPLDHRALLLPTVRLAKAYSLLVNQLGHVGPVPEGMSAMAAARTATFNARHRAIADVVHHRAEQFHEKNHYWPPYWKLLKWSRQAVDEASPASQ